ncbi:hypothetical protein [Myxosarcina sp. GI1]|uniref:hypothetical protein n=1 Tax=Myxosarcina sp. GI1 TaxID=1541065 RepID=UPI00056CD64F|nr:hypothetical protein [Myxosarcina sp. GI1]
MVKTDLISGSQTKDKVISFLESELTIINQKLGKADLVALLQEMNPEVVALDLASTQAQANDDLEILTQNFSQIKILAINAPNKAMMLKAIEQGASACTNAEISYDEMKLVLQTLHQECVLVDSKRLEPYFIVIPKSKIAPKVEKWQFGTGIELINYWRSEPCPYALSIETFLREIGVDNFVIYLKKGRSKFTIVKELERITESLCQDNRHGSLGKKLEHTEKSLAKWFFNPEKYTDENCLPNCCLAVVRSNARQIRKLSVVKIQKLFKLWDRAGSYTLSQWSNKTISSLKKWEINFEQTRQQAINRLYLSKTAYQNLSNKLKKDEAEQDFESAIRALMLQYKDLIRAEVLGAASQIAGELIEELCIYRKQVLTTDTLLFSFQKALQNKLDTIANDPTLPEVYWTEAELKRLDIPSIRANFEKSLGKPLNQWGSLPKEKHETINKKILDRSRKLSLKLILERY